MTFFNLTILASQAAQGFFTMTFFNCLTIFVAIVSAGVNVISFFKTKKWAKTAREDELSKKLFVDFLLEQFPTEYKKFTLSKDWLNAGKEFSTVIKQFRHQILYFKYSHSSIYGNVMDALEILDEQISKASTTDIDSTHQRDAVENAMADAMDSIYRAFLVELPNDRIERYFKKSNRKK